jgi:hypothetical protein
MVHSAGLQEKIVRAYDEQLGSRCAIVELFGVSPRLLKSCSSIRRSAGEIALLPHGGERQPT